MGIPTTPIENGIRLPSHLPSVEERFPSSTGNQSHEAERRKTLSRFSALSLAPVNPDVHAKLIQTSQEVAALLGTQPVALYEIAENRSNVLLTLLFCAPSMLLINFDFFERLSPDEQKAMLAHELKHARQPLHRVDMARRIGLNIEGFVTALTRISLPMAKSMERVLSPFYRGCISYIERQEAEADQAAITLTDIHTVTAAATKTCAYILEKCYGQRVGTEQSAIDVALHLDAAANRQRRPVAKFTGDSLVERVHRLDAIAKRQALTLAV